MTSASALKLGAELTFTSVGKAQITVSKVIMDKSSARLRLDLSDVVYCDSAGIALLIETQRLCKKNNKTFEVIGMSSEIESLAEFCGVKNILVMK